MQHSDRTAGRPRSLPPTEQRNPRSRDLDNLSSLGVLQLLNKESEAAITAVDEVLPQLAEVVDLAAERMRHGGTVHYFGAGTSGRLGVLDASELKPTFNLEPGRVMAHIAGGSQALVEAVENAEDSVAEGRQAAAGLGPDDVAIGLAASGSTPYVGGALEAAREAGAYTVLISNNPEAPLSPVTDVHLALDTGPEVVTGSTRLKAGTAQKLVLNGFSTALMIALGRTWQNLMVSVVATNAKLRDRTVRILCEAVGVEEPAARELLERTGGDLKAAIVTSLTGVSSAEAYALLEEHAGSVRDAIQAATPEAVAPAQTEEPGP
ncbi:N-acetylmuramic acid 6-phosphate etherase [Nesterenkonia massiliensis]|uniref:N-acetylmuramic acid 6-phosphate etherase n=1 Tax=Nesterenkonia massiliensis TaxID=1232429 RepID=A0ABT2HSV9_9MICC|nr:N-acetylmuramic acid 6-phosphate etherase [Nesterenkonia massiliensis]MCT1607778.1 N-acetylmuramic acid 6-phosphate etherase [Nesterenkonia massiliensis]